MTDVSDAELSIEWYTPHRTVSVPVGATTAQFTVIDAQCAHAYGCGSGAPTLGRECTRPFP